MHVNNQSSGEPRAAAGTGRPVTVGLVQINNSFSGQCYLPYSVGLLQSHLQANLTTPDRFRFLLPEFVRRPVAEIVRIHSGKDPVGEAERLPAFACPDTQPSTLFIVGPGPGYVFDALERRRARPHVIAIGPMAAMARGMLARRSWRHWLDDGRLPLMVAPDYPAASELWKPTPGRARRRPRAHGDPSIGARPGLAHRRLGRFRRGPVAGHSLAPCADRREPRVVHERQRPAQAALGTVAEMARTIGR